MNFLHNYRNKFAAETCKRFPLHLSNVTTLPCET